MGGEELSQFYRKSSVNQKSYPVYNVSYTEVSENGLRDEDSLVYIAGTFKEKKPPKFKNLRETF